ADEEVEPERTHDGDRDQIDDRQVVLVDAERQHEEEEYGERRDGPAGDGQWVQGHVGLVRRLEHPTLAMDHGQLQTLDAQGCRGVGGGETRSRRVACGGGASGWSPAATGHARARRVVEPPPTPRFPCVIGRMDGALIRARWWP